MIRSQNYVIVVLSQKSVNLCLTIFFFTCCLKEIFASQGCAKVLWGNLVWGCLVVLGVVQGAQRTFSSCRSTTPVCTALPRLPGTIGQVFQCLWLLQVGSSQLMQVWCVSMCWFFVFDPLDFLLWDAHSFSYFVIQLHLQATPEIWEHQHNIISYTLFSLWWSSMYVCMYVHMLTWVCACQNFFSTTLNM